MSDALKDFFSAWSDENPETRKTTLAGAMAQGFAYADPKTDSQIKDLDALAEYVGEFSKGAPGWTATVMQIDTVAGFDRVLVGFGDAGGVQMHGQYFGKTDGEGKIRRLIGFKGTGSPE